MRRYIAFFSLALFAMCTPKQVDINSKSFYDTSNYYMHDSGFLYSPFASEKFFSVINETDFLKPGEQERHLLFVKEYFFLYRLLVFSVKVTDSNSYIASTTILTSDKHLELDDLSVIFNNGFRIERNTWTMSADTAARIFARVDNHLNRKSVDEPMVIDENSKDLLYLKNGQYYILNDDYLGREMMDKLEALFFDSVLHLSVQSGYPK